MIVNYSPCKNYGRSITKKTLFVKYIREPYPHGKSVPIIRNVPEMLIPHRGIGSNCDSQANRNLHA